LAGNLAGGSRVASDIFVGLKIETYADVGRVFWRGGEPISERRLPYEKEH